jgi:hypothetical protein
MKTSVLILLALTALPLFAQEEEDQLMEIPSAALERYIGSDAEGNRDSYEEYIRIWEENPLDINTASREELMRIPGMTVLLAAMIIDRRSAVPFTDLSELLLLDGLTPEAYPIIAQCLIVRKKTASRSNRGAFRQTVVRDLQESEGEKEGKFAGSPFLLRSRLNASIRMPDAWSSSCPELRIGWSGEKDAGEPLKYSAWSGYCSAVFPKFSSTLLLGDYSVGEGQGMIFWHYNGYGKAGEEISSVRKNSNGIHPSLSTNENWRFRGAALETVFGNVQIRLFASWKSLNARVDSNGVLQSLEESGIYRTETEIRKRHSAFERLYGMCAEFQANERFRIGVCGCRSTVDCLRADIDMTRGLKNGTAMFGANAAYTAPGYALFAESAWDDSRRTAALGGIQMHPMEDFLLTIVGRSYPKNFYSLYGNSFAEGGSGIEETGLYTGVVWNAWKGLRFLSCYDQFVCGKEESGVAYDNAGYEFILGSEWNVRKNCEIDLRYAGKKTKILDAEEDALGRTIDVVAERIQRKYRIDMTWKLPRGIESTTRFDYDDLRFEGSGRREDGFLLLQDVSGRPAKFLSAVLRFMFFHTSSYDSRLYAYESDLPGSYASAAMYGEGYRWYVILEFRVLPKAILSAKYMQMKKNFVDSLGSGDDAIEGSVLRRIGIQFDYSL